MRCNRADCGRGEIDDQGFCTECNRRPLAPAAGDGAPAESPSSPADRASRPAAACAPAEAEQPASPAPFGVERVRPEPWWGLELARSGRVPPVPDIPPGEEPLLDEEQRYCSECGRPVGRGRGGAPGRVSGFCPKCTTPFDFSRPPIGQLFLGRYEYVRRIGAGGQGTTYLVRDRNLGAEVVLKALRSSVGLTLAERDALVGLRHDSIVRILNYEPDGPYLVLEHVPGVELAPGTADPLDVVLAHGLQILQALDYLHARNLLHCDVKPSNIVRFEDVTADRRDRIRLIDFGAVRALGDRNPVSVYSHRYAPAMRNPETGRVDPEHENPTAAFDLYCLGSTLAELCEQHVNRAPRAPGVESLQLLIRRATAVDEPRGRFTSARQFAEQLSGVVRQVMADPALAQPRRVARPSVLFDELTGALDGGLGSPRPLEQWARAKVSADDSLELPPPFARPAASDVLNALPMPLADPDEADPSRSALEARTACRAALRGGEAQEAARALGNADLPSWHWLRFWYAGSIALCRADVDRAAQQFTAVRRMLPGELIPMLALGLCAELGGAFDDARRYYEAVARTAPALEAAGFGLARVLLLAGRRGDAVRAAERLAAAGEFRLAPGPRIAVIRLLIARPEPAVCAPPGKADLARAGDLLEASDLDAEARTALEAEVEYARHRLFGDGAALSETVRRAAVSAKTRSEFVALIDLANRLRPPVRWTVLGRPISGRGKREVPGAASG